jgi:L,D-peptidoglycan transpeptidase YkuD (ErfK/YbiS/YcfS/YnhG family)
VSATGLARDTCPPSLPSQMAASDDAGQLVTVVAATGASTTAVITAWERSGTCWTAALGPWIGRVGAHGMRLAKREGDGATPIGLFAVYSTIYGTGPNPGVHGAYRRLRCGDWWDEDVASPAYNSFQQVPCRDTDPPFANGASEPLWLSPAAYAALAVIGYNTARVAGRGSGIFLHVSLGRATTGCVALARPLLDRLLVWLRMVPLPRIGIATRATIATL